MSGTRLALISGANRGIGAAVAERLFADGWAISLGMRKPQMPEWAAAEPARAHVFAYDATDPASAGNWVAEAAATYGRIDALIANAGISVPKTVVEIPEEEFDRMLEVNVSAPRRLAAAAWDLLAVSGRGRVIVLASLSGKRVKTTASGAYSVTKFAAVGLAHALRHAGFDRGIRATAICPGFVATDMAMALTDRPTDQMTSPADLARVIAMLLDLPNEASVAEFCINCQLEESF